MSYRFIVENPCNPCLACQAGVLIHVIYNYMKSYIELHLWKK